MCLPLLSMKMSVSQLASLTSHPLRTNLSKHVNLWASSVGSWSHYPQDTVCVLALFAVHSGDFFPVSRCVWQRLQRRPQMQCGTDGSVPTASHFHKQMSDNLMTPSAPLPPCTHTSYVSPLAPSAKCPLFVRFTSPASSYLVTQSQYLNSFSF